MCCVAFRCVALRCVACVYVCTVRYGTLVVCCVGIKIKQARKKHIFRMMTYSSIFVGILIFKKGKREEGKTLATTNNKTQRKSSEIINRLPVLWLWIVANLDRLAR